MQSKLCRKKISVKKMQKKFFCSLKQIFFSFQRHWSFCCFSVQKLQGCYFETISKYSCECFKTFQKEIAVKIVSLKTKNEVVPYLNYVESRSKEIFAEKRFGKRAKFMTKDEVKVELEEGELPKSIFLKIKDGVVERSEVSLGVDYRDFTII